MKIEIDDTVLIVLHSPREKLLGSLREINSAGVFLRGFDLSAFDEFIRATQDSEGFYGMAEMFLPMWRIEKISLDETIGEIPSMHEQFEKRTGKRFEDA